VITQSTGGDKEVWVGRGEVIRIWLAQGRPV